MTTNKTTGNQGETLAAAYLQQKGYTIMEKNWRFRRWEVDIIASKGKFLHIFEVKTRRSNRFGNPEESIDRDKMTGMKNAAEEYQYQHPEWKFVQFNVLAITMQYDEPIEYFLIEDVYF